MSQCPSIWGKYRCGLEAGHPYAHQHLARWWNDGAAQQNLSLDDVRWVVGMVELIRESKHPAESTDDRHAAVAAARAEGRRAGLKAAERACKARAARRADHAHTFPNGDERATWLDIKAGEAEACASDIRDLMEEKP